MYRISNWLDILIVVDILYIILYIAIVRGGKVSQFLWIDWYHKTFPVKYCSLYKIGFGHARLPSITKVFKRIKV